MQTKLKLWLDNAPHGYAMKLAQRANMSAQTLYKIANNKGNLSIEKAMDICRAVRQLNHERQRIDGVSMECLTMEDFINERS